MKPTTRSSILARIRAVTAAEDGFALVAVMGVMIASLALASAASLAAVNSLRGAGEDADRKDALAAADAGSQIALARQNTIAQSGASSCLFEGAGGQLYSSAPEPDGWCAPVTGSVDEGTYSYRTRPTSDESVEIVSTGSDGRLARRIELTAENEAAAGVFSEFGVIGDESIFLDSNATIEASAASNGTIETKSNSGICGPVTHGPAGEFIIDGDTQEGETHSGGKKCSGTFPLAPPIPVALAPVMQGNVPPSAGGINDNALLPGTISGKKKEVSWIPSTRELTLDSNVAITLPGGRYSLCRLQLDSNSTIFIAAGASVTMYFDDPANCPNLDGEPQLQLDSNSKIRPTSGATGDLAMLFVGNPEIPTAIELNSNFQANSECINDFVIYAPETDISFDSNVTYCGAVAGKTVELNSNTTIRTSAEAQNYVLPGAGSHYDATRFLECPSVAADGTDAGC